MSTPNLLLPTSPTGATDVSAPYNLAMQTLDGVAQCAVQDVLNTPPTTSDTVDLGKAWQIGSTPTGIWAGKANQIALCVGTNLWLYFAAGTQVKYFLNLSNGGFYKWDAGWVLAGGLNDAPSDGTEYLRKDGSWVHPASSGGISDAPSDGTQYLRESGAWVHPDVGEAPSDGTPYVRQDASWVAAPTGGSGIPDAPSDGKRYVRKDAAWVEDAMIFSPVEAVTATTRTLLDADKGKYLRFTNSATKTLSVGGTLTVSAEFHGRNVGAGALTLAGTGGFVLNAPAGGSLVVPAGGTFTIKIVGTTEADVIGVTNAP
ncbi:minor tail protein [Stenotrophomonas phage Sonora]|nr:minor tail protein [Stenotrophomonas phage Sonora]